MTSSIATGVFAPPSIQPPVARRVGRYAIFGEIASGGMATVYFGRLAGPVGFSRSVAIKQLHPQYARSPEFVAQFLDEARLTARIRHPNVVSVLDVVARQGELFVVMEYVQGEPLSRLMRLAQGPVPVSIAVTVMTQVLLGLHAAHEATSDRGEPLEIVHRDVSPQNILVRVDGTSQVLDFGVAKAASRIHTTENGAIKGKVAYMAPEQLEAKELDRRADVFAAGVVLWEALAGRRLFTRPDAAATMHAVLFDPIAAPSSVAAGIPEALDHVVLRALARDRDQRFASAREMAVALEQCIAASSAMAIGNWVEAVAGTSLEERARRLRLAEESSSSDEIFDASALQSQLLGSSSAPPQDLPATDPPGSAGATQAYVAPAPPRPWWRNWWPLALAAAGGMVVAMAALGGGAARAPAAVNTPPVPTAAVIAAPAARGVTTESVSDSPSALPVASSAPTAKVPARPAPVHAARPASKSSRKTNCSPPFATDAKGNKLFKPECF